MTINAGNSSAQVAQALTDSITPLVIDSTYESRELVWNLICRIGMPIMRDVQKSIATQRAEGRSESDIATNPALRASNRTKQNIANLKVHKTALIDQLVLDHVMTREDAVKAVDRLQAALTAVCSTWSEVGNKPVEQKDDSDNLFAGLL